MRNTISTLLLALTLAPALGCSLMARDTSTYESDTSALLDTRADALQACYDKQMAFNPALAGKLTITFTVEKKSGKITQLAWDRDRTTVSEDLATCVVTALDGLELDPVDQRDGVATFTYTFRQKT